MPTEMMISADKESEVNGGVNILNKFRNFKSQAFLAIFFMLYYEEQKQIQIITIDTIHKDKPN